MIVLSLLGLTACDRVMLQLQHPLEECEDSLPAIDASFQLSRALAPSGTACEWLRLLLQDGVSVEIARGCVLVRVRGLSPLDAERLSSETALSELTADADWCAWLQRGARAAQLERNITVPVDDVVLIAGVALSDERTTPHRETDETMAMAMEFVPLNNDSARELSASACILLARHLQASLRSSADDARVMVWFAVPDAVFRTCAFSTRVANLYAELFASMNAFVAGKHRSEFIYVGNVPGFFVFSQARLAAEGAQFVARVLDTYSANRRDEVAVVGDAAVNMAESATKESVKEQMVEPQNVRFIDASGRDFAGEDPATGLWLELGFALGRAEKVRWLALSGSRLSEEQIGWLLARVPTHPSLETVLIGCVLWRQLLVAGRIAEESRFVPSLVRADMPFSSEAVRQRTIARVARLRAASLLLSAAR
jgi:hypothetical protein